MESAGSQAAFLERNAAESLPAGGLEKKLGEVAARGGQLRVKLGLDPTAPDIHLGHTVVLQKLRALASISSPLRAGRVSERPLGSPTLAV